MKKIALTKDFSVATTKKVQVLKNGNWVLEKIENKLYLSNVDNTINDVFDMVMLAIKDKELNSSDFWNTKVSINDKKDANELNMFYWMSGGDKIWKDNTLWKKDWSEMAEVFSEHFSDRVLLTLNTCKTLSDIKKKIVNKYSSLDFYELGLKLDLINENND